MKCEKYDRDRMEMLRVILTESSEMGCEMNEVIERTGRELMLLLELCQDRGGECTND